MLRKCAESGRNRSSSRIGGDLAVINREGQGMHEDQALLAMTLVARRASDWAHSVVTSKPFSDGVITGESVARFRSEILAALAILDRPK